MGILSPEGLSTAQQRTSLKKNEWNIHKSPKPKRSLEQDRKPFQRLLLFQFEHRTKECITSKNLPTWRASFEGQCDYGVTATQTVKTVETGTNG